MTTLRTTRTRAAGILAAITTTAVLAACSSDSDSGADMGLAEPSSQDNGSGSGSEAGGAAEDRATSRTFSGQSGEDAGSDSAPGTLATERAIVSSGTVSLTSKDVGAARRDVQRIVDAQRGEVTEEDTETDDEGETSYARMVLRVPSSAFDEAMQALEDVAVLRSSNRGSEDVTTQVIDTGVRVRAQEASLKRVELLLARAKTLKDIIWIESQLTNRQAELDSLKSQQTWLQDQTSLSTITVDITAKHDAKAEEPDDEEAGFLTGLEGGLDALAGTALVVATVVGALLPFAVVLLVLGVPAWLLLRRRRRGSPQPAAPKA
ncbi:DUF4349 domain-containing protein [Microbacterium sp. ARD31]|uniref:DUF4349 domain-containing protein n=1 Tax=Microbacterium sp. ARD31 TaxID=2962576 RepID=UPI002880DFCB|nr:DUF4349 domain-containing protein [Microbacterium sp. ARD31]MDT0185386.1 DUF4349 domain-containing protein [Microbacterium sp. ARD31]